MTIQHARGVGPSKIDIAYERLGDPSAPSVLLIMGLGMQLVAWPDAFCAELVARGLHVIRFDNRDAGESTHFQGIPDFAAAMAGDTSSTVYRLTDMAADTAGLLDALAIDRAHVVGASLGGFIAQTLAIEHRARVASLTSIMSSTGDPTVGWPHPEIAQLFVGGPPRTREVAMQQAVAGHAIIGSPGFPRDPEVIAAAAARAFDRAHDPTVYLRQGVAVLASGDRTPRLRQLAVPTLVIHGDRDKLIDVSGGRATAAAIPGAELVIVEGMGHDLPAPLWGSFADRIAALVQRASSASIAR